MLHLENRGTISVLRMEYGKVQAVDVELLEALEQNFASLASSNCRAVVLTGTGKAFSAGVDLFRLLEGGSAYQERFIPLLCSALEMLFLFPKPVIAAVNGHALAGGCIFTCACDYRIMVRSGATIGVTELRVGVPFPAVALEIMRFAMAPQFLQQAIYSGKPYPPEDALRIGMLDELSDPESLLDRACRVAETYAEIPSESFSITKHQLRQPAMDRAHLDPNAALVIKQWKSPEIHNVIRGYLQKTIGQKNK